MKTCGAIASVVFCCAGASVAPAQSTFIMHFDSVQNGYNGGAQGIEETAQGYLVTGWQEVSSDPYAPHTFIRSIDQQGQFVSQQEWWPGAVSRIVQGEVDPIVKVNDSCFVSHIWQGILNSSSSPEISFVRFTQHGDTLETKPILHSANDSVMAGIAQTCMLNDSGFAMVGSILQPGQNLWAWVIRLNASGDTIWTRKLSAQNAYMEAHSVSPMPDGGFVVGGGKYGSGIDNRNVLFRMDSTGAVLWQNHFGDDAHPRVSVRTDASGNVFTWSSYRETSWSPGFYQVFDLRKWSQTGALLWSKRTEWLTEVASTDFEVLPDGSFVTIGNVGWLASLMKFDSMGDSLWQRFYTPFVSANSGTTFPYDVLPTSDGGFAFCGCSDQGPGDPTPGLQTMFVIKTDSMGCVVPGCQFVGIAENVIGLENTLNAYPNPSSGQFTLELTLPSSVLLSGDLTLQVFDAQGRLVERRNLGRQLEQRIALDLTAQPTGLYSAHLSDGKRILTGVRLVVE